MRKPLRLGPLRLAAVALVLVGLTAAPASARQELRILAPSQDQLVPKRTEPVGVRVQFNGPARQLRAELRWSGGRSSRVKLHRGRGGLFVGRLTAKQLRRGRNHLFVWATARQRIEAAEIVHFTVARKRRGDLSVRIDGAGGSPVRVGVRIGREATFRATLNGHPVRGEFERRGRQRLVATLAADNGLRFGRNRLVLTAFDRYRGDYRRVVRRFNISRSAPLVGAGHDRVGDSGAAIRLDGSATRPGRGQLDLRWRIVGKPVGSRARLRGAGLARPLLVGAAPGRYRVALSAAQGPRRGRATASAAGASDVTEVCVQPDVLPAEGEPIETIVSSGEPKVVVGATSYKLENPSQNWAQLVVLDSCSLQLVSNTSFAANTTGLQAFAGAVSELPAGQLAIVSGGGAPLDVPPEGQSNLSVALTELGAAIGNEGFGELGAVASGDFSIVSTRGAPPGVATQLIGMSRGGQAPAGAVKGVLQIGSSGDFTFNSQPSFVPFDTMAPGSDATTNTIKVGEREYTATLPARPAGGFGFHLVWLDGASLAPRGEYAFPIEPFDSEKSLYGFAETLHRIAGEPGGSVIILSSFGNPNWTETLNCCAYNTQPLAVIATELEQFGANRFAFLEMEGKGSYSFIGAKGLAQLLGSNAGTELSQGLAKTASGRITGLLTPNAQGLWLPSGTGSPPSPTAAPVAQTQLAKILAQPLEPFEALEPDAEMAAQRYIYEQLRLGGGRGSKGFDPKHGIRRIYWNTGTSFDASSFLQYQSELGRIEPCKAPAACAANFAHVRKVLEREFGEVADVKKFFSSKGEEGTMAEILSEAAEGTNGIGYTSVVTYITSLYAMPPSPESSGPSFETILNSALGVAGGVVGFIPEEGGYASSALYMMESVNELVGALTTEPGGVPAYDAVRFQGDVLEWGNHLETIAHRAVAALETVAGQVVSDQGRLRAMSALLRTPASNNGEEEGGLDYSSGEVQQLVTALQRSQAKYLWQTMLPLPLQAYNGVCTREEAERWPGNTKVTVASKALHPTETPPYEPVYNTTLRPVSIVAGERDPLPIETSTAQLLFGEPTSSKVSNEGPLGFKPQYLLSPHLPAASVLANPGFNYASAEKDFILQLEGCSP